MPPSDCLQIDRARLDQLMPMHLVVAPCGSIRHMAPTIRRILGPPDPARTRIFDLFEIRRPREARCTGDLRRLAGVTLGLRLKERPGTTFKGLAVPVGPGARGDLLVNLGFGISAVDAVGHYRLTASDFAPTDATVELLYLAEANRAVLTESRNLNRRLQGAMIAAEEQAFTDTLTGLKNRRAMEHILTRLAGAEADFALMLVDLDFFKQVNDGFGHAAGDHVLQSVARTLISATRAQDAVVRAGGDEFVLIFPGLTDRERLARIAGRIIEGLEKPIAVERTTCRISASIGIVTTAGYGHPDPEAMLRDADAALYASKHAGRARFAFGGPDAAQTREAAGEERATHAGDNARADQAAPGRRA
ncbi:diguanylate cyclase (GGDEF) domain-containing protein [Meinhardsimonia xiamenensis]|uniref:Diguanylate cyclase (GGDEF) domain-containing protein n=2 Tax=Meinhardsimonia xiamenensis TaxID=990712 RepID=A0A1G9CTF2_9RHOB|nr:diguanylate cyclase (GGDEF)-like protein [Meinhardsimonia xiamenensis]SDK54674.1 diguanylate cyclase (GGDEF) domain-containing protein [Meinhardsimonia xiamenensis]